MNFNSDELIKNGTTRTFAQYAGPGTRKYFFGEGTEYNFIDSASVPTNGSIDPIFVPDPRKPNRYKLVGRQIGAPTLPQAKITFMEKWDGIPRMLLAPKCPMNFYEVHSRCGDFSDFNRGWEGYINIYSQFLPTDTVDMGARSSMSADEPLADGVNFTGANLYPVGQLSFGEEATTEVVVEVVDVVYGTQIQCANCGTPNDGTQFIYAITRANVGSPAAPGQLVYSLDGGATWSTSTVTGIGSVNQPTLIEVAGNVLFVVAGTSLFYTLLNKETGAPSTWSSFTLPAAMVDAYVASPAEIYFVAGTTVYRTVDVTIAPTAIDANAPATLTRVIGYDSTIIAVGNTGAVRYSTNAGITWTTAVAPGAVNLNAVAARKGYWLVGGADGNVYLSKDSGTTWSTLAIPQAGTGAINDIIMPTFEVIWVAQTISNVAYLATTMDGGDSWANNASGSARIVNFPTFRSISRMAAPIDADAGIAANYLTIGGLATGGADGILIAAAPTIV